MLSSGSCGMLFEQIGEAPPAQRLSPGVDEHLWCCDLPANGEPGAQRCGGGLPQGKRPHQTLIRFLERDRQDAANMVQGYRLPVFEEAEEGLDGRQSDVARHRRVFARILEILQEGADEASVELFQRQRRWPDLQSLRGEHEEQLEAQGIGVTRVPTDATLAGERLVEEHLDEGSNRRHDCLPSQMNSSPAAATSRMRSAVASRYQ
jgi:hypothetical protein